MMKKFGLILLLLIFPVLPCRAKTKPPQEINSGASNIFIYHIPDDTAITPDETKKEDIPPLGQTQDIVSDDVTADTSGNFPDYDYDEDESYSPAAGIDYDIKDMYSDVLKGYAAYNEDEQDSICLEDDIKDFQELNIKLPAKVKGSKYTASKHITDFPSLSYSKFNNIEYSIAPVSSTNYRKKGAFSAGTIYNQSIDYAELEQQTGIFSRYENKYFALSTAYAKTINSTNNNYNDNFYFSPELKLNQYFTLKEILSADTARNIKKAEVILSINPFGNLDKDRLRFEIGANATYDDTNTLLKNQFKFSTRFKL